MNTSKTTPEAKAAAAIREALVAAEIYNEDGEPMVDFDYRGRDAADFASCVSRGTLERMLRQAYEAGLRAGAKE